jgi:hypothetical protein
MYLFLITVMKAVQVTVNPVQFNVFPKIRFQIINRSRFAQGLTQPSYNQIFQYIVIYQV